MLQGQCATGEPQKQSADEVGDDEIDCKSAHSKSSFRTVAQSPKSRSSLFLRSSRSRSSSILRKRFSTSCGSLCPADPSPKSARGAPGLAAEEREPADPWAARFSLLFWLRTSSSSRCSEWVSDRSEERRVGKECRSRWAPCQ